MELPDCPIKFLSVFTNEYVLRITDDGSHLSADDKDPSDEMGQFKFEKARDGMWQIKCLATGKYWQVKPSRVIRCITPDGDKSNDDTLFTVECFGPGQTTTIRLLHHKTNRYACVHSAIDKDPLHLWAIYTEPDKDSKDVFVYSKF